MNCERKPVETLAELDLLDSNETIEGYRDGYDGEPEPGDNRSLSYWHGWRNGRVDGGHAKGDLAQERLAREWVRRPKAVIGEGK